MAQRDHIGEVNIKPLDMVIIQAFKAKIQAAANVEYPRIRMPRQKCADHRVNFSLSHEYTYGR